MRNKKGFTLIELLVVIAIIGLLSTLAVVSLNSARGKARDASRVSAVKQMADILEMEATEGTGTAALATCTAADALTSTCTGPGQVSQFSASLATCGYSISQSSGAAAATVGNYEICFYLEQGVGGLSAGLNKVITGGIMSATCL
ncbi:MAG: type II secretion system protein [Candidatus Komeilibacteria bacterium]|nr:type II secretion system protein [Candidatus Komeilibacteria bacterium]